MARKLLLSLTVLIMLIACKKENTPTTILNETIDNPMAQVKVMGNFTNGPYGLVSGSAKVYKIGNELQFALENFSSSNGPNLKVYLSRELHPINFLDLGDLKSISGNQLYKIPDGIDIEQYTYALIYCKQYSHLFGSAPLVK